MVCVSGCGMIKEWIHPVVKSYWTSSTQVGPSTNPRKLKALCSYFWWFFYFGLRRQTKINVSSVIFISPWYCIFLFEIFRKYQGAPAKLIFPSWRKIPAKSCNRKEQKKCILINKITFCQVTRGESLKLKISKLEWLKHTLWRVRVPWILAGYQWDISWPTKKTCPQFLLQNIGGSKIFKTGARQPPRWGYQPIIWWNWMKMKEIGPGAGRFTGAPLNPSMQKQFLSEILCK